MRFTGVETTAARFAWFYMTGAWPDGELEHINENKIDCRWSNIRVRDNSKKKELTAKILREMFNYDPVTGFFTKLTKHKRWAAGRGIGSVTGEQYKRIKINVCGKQQMAHRMAWLHYYGEWPSMDIDHIDGDACNNAIANLRLATDSQNLGNMKKPITNTSGFKGVFWHKGGKKWQASIKIEGVHMYLGLFNTAEEAHEAYCRAAVDGRGEFARFA